MTTAADLPAIIIAQTPRGYRVVNAPKTAVIAHGALRTDLRRMRFMRIAGALVIFRGWDRRTVVYRARPRTANTPRDGLLFDKVFDDLEEGSAP